LLVIGRSHIANTAAFGGGAALFVWTVSEMFLFRSVHVLQLAYLAIAIAIMAEALRRRGRAERHLKRLVVVATRC
jgi:preprotein translocase subunit SecG